MGSFKTAGDGGEGASFRTGLVTINSDGVEAAFLGALARALRRAALMHGVTVEAVDIVDPKAPDDRQVPSLVIAGDDSRRTRVVDVVWNGSPSGALARPMLVLDDREAARLATHRLWQEGCTRIVLAGAGLSPRQLAAADGYAAALAELDLPFDPDLVATTADGRVKFPEEVPDRGRVGILAVTHDAVAQAGLSADHGPVLCLQPSPTYPYFGAGPERLATMVASLLFDEAAARERPAAHDVPLERVDVGY